MDSWAAILDSRFSILLTRAFLHHPVRVTHLVRDGDEIGVGGLRLRVYHTPGHSPGHLGLHEPRSGVFVAADLVWGHRNPPRFYPIGDVAALLTSLERVVALRPTWLGTGHFLPVAGESRTQAFFAERFALVAQTERAVLGALDHAGQTCVRIARRAFPAARQSLYDPAPAYTAHAYLTKLLREHRVTHDRLADGAIIWRAASR